MKGKGGEQDDWKIEKIPINFASFGQQEILWLFNQLYVLLLKKEKAFVIIEEPEAHLYPTLQKRVIDFIGFFAKINESEVLITTHSPYILTSSNLLYVAGLIIKKFPEKKKQVYEILKLNAEINVDSFQALKMNPDRSIENLVDGEIEEIKTERIDEISDEVNEEYVKLFI